MNLAFSEYYHISYTSHPLIHACIIPAPPSISMSAVAYLRSGSECLQVSLPSLVNISGFCAVTAGLTRLLQRYWI